MGAEMTNKSGGERFGYPVVKHLTHVADIFKTANRTKILY